MGGIGVMDSGVGGLTAARAIAARLPGERMLYLCDGANCPYGNRTEAEIFGRAVRMIGFLAARQVACVVLACNTVSALSDRLRAVSPIPLVSMIGCGARTVAAGGYASVGVVATRFTAESGAYEAAIRRVRPGCRVTVRGSERLAGLIERAGADRAAIRAEIRRLSEAFRGEDLRALLLGCTHYPLAAADFAACFPGLSLLDPAGEAAAEAAGLHGVGCTPGGFEIFTTGGVETCLRVAAGLGLPTPLRACSVRF